MWIIWNFFKNGLGVLQLLSSLAELCVNFYTSVASKLLFCFFGAWNCYKQGYQLSYSIFPATSYCSPSITLYLITINQYEILFLGMLLSSLIDSFCWTLNIVVVRLPRERPGKLSNKFSCCQFYYSVNLKEINLYWTQHSACYWSRNYGYYYSMCGQPMMMILQTHIVDCSQTKILIL